MSFPFRLLVRGALPAFVLLVRAAAAQDVTALSLDDALRRAQGQSEALRIAQAGVLRADGQRLQARSQYFPQVNGSAGYTRTLATQFSALAPAAAPTPPASVPPAPARDTATYYQPCTRYLAPPGASEADRLRGVELFSRCSVSGSGLDFTRVGFGARNQYQVAAAGSLTLWSGGRVQAQVRAADAGRRSADLGVASQKAQLALDVTEAYYDAVLADRLVAIAESSLAWTEGTLRQATLARQVGNQSEFDLLRARVVRDNQVPVLLQRRTGRDLAYLRLKQLLNLPFEGALRLTSDIREPAEATDARLVADRRVLPGGGEVDTSVSARAPVRQLDEALRAQEAQLAIARSAHLPTVSLTSAYSRVAFGSGSIPSWGNWLNNWTVGVGASFPLFTGGRTRGEALVARAGVEEARARLEQVRELAALDALQTVAQLQLAEAALAASAGTAEQAARAFTIANVRYTEGLSTQMELSESRLNLEQARINRAQAARNVEVARMRIALLKDLPLGTGAPAAGATNGSAAMGGASMGGAPSAMGGGGAPQQAPRGATQQASASQIPQ